MELLYETANPIIVLLCVFVSKTTFTIFIYIKMNNTVEPHYLELAYFELPLISK